MTELKNESSIIKFLIAIIALLVIIIFLLLGWKISKLHFLGVELEPPSTFTPAGIATSLPTATEFQNQAPTSNLPVSQPTLIQSVSTTRLLSLNMLRQVLDETSSERVEITLGKLRELCNQGTVTCYDNPNCNWSITGPALIGTDPLQQPIIGAQVVKVNRDTAGNWLPNWPIGLFYVPSNQTVLVPTPGVAYPLEAALPAEWIIR
ncbi:MAG: hypothetical protein QXO24_02015 [Candidatus Micrarchaeaceae archaeon]